MIIDASASKNLTFDLYIPSFLIEDKELSITEKFLMGIIEALTKKKGYCYATNKFLAEKLNVEPTYISRLISKLTKLGYLITEFAKNNEFFEYSGRRIYLSEKVKNFYSKTIKRKTKTPNTTFQSRSIIKNKKSSIEYLKEKNKKQNKQSCSEKSSAKRLERFKAMKLAKTNGAKYNLRHCSENDIKRIVLKIEELTPEAKQRIEDQIVISRPIIDELAGYVPVNAIIDAIESLFRRKKGYALKELKRKKASYLLKDFKEELIDIHKHSNSIEAMFDDSKWQKAGC